MKNTENIIFEGYPKKMLCWDDNEMNAKECIVLCKVLWDEHGYVFKVISLNGNWGVSKHAKDIPQSKPRRIEDGLEEGDILISSNGYEVMVLGKCGKVYFISIENKFSSKNEFYYAASTPYTLQELIDDGYVLKSETSSNDNAVEMTVAEVSKLVGKNVKIIE